MVAGPTMSFNSGAVEGIVNRVKQLKAAMCGRAKPDLLRQADTACLRTVSTLARSV